MINKNLQDKMAAAPVMTEEVLVEILSGICDDEHSSCNDECPVYEMNNSQCVGADKPFSENRGCDCFKNGTAMLKFIRNNQ